MRSIDNYDKKDLLIRIYKDDESYTEYTSDDIVGGTTKINNKSVSSTDFEFGSVITATLSFALFSEEGRYGFYDKKVKIYEVHDSNEIQLGEYYISEVSAADGVLEFVSYTKMNKFDTDIIEETDGTVFDLLKYMCDMFGIPLGMTKEECDSLVNGNYIYHIDVQSGTYMEVLQQLGKITCSFAYIDDEGKFILKQYSDSVNETYSDDDRINSVISDYTVYYYGVSALFRSSDSDVYTRYDATNSNDTEGLYMELGNIPIVKYASNTSTKLIKAIADYLETIRYVPATFELEDDISIQLGDKVKLVDLYNMQDCYSYIQSVEYNYNGNSRYEAVGTNPRLNEIKSSTQKQIQNVSDSVSKEYLVLTTYTNATNYKIKDAGITIARLTFSTSKDETSAILGLSVQFDLETDGNVHFEIYLDGAKLDGQDRVGYYLAGSHNANIVTYVSCSIAAIYEISVKMYTEQINSELRQNNAKIVSLINYTSTGTYTESTPDSTIPIANIEMYGVHAYVIVKGHAVENKWDGTITVADEVNNVNLVGLIFNPSKVSDSIGVNLYTPIGDNIIDTVEKVALGYLQVDTSKVNTTIQFTKEVQYKYINTDKAADYTYNTDYVDISDNKFVLKTSYQYNAVEETIDSGRMSIVSINTEQFDTVSLINIEVS